MLLSCTQGWVFCEHFLNVVVLPFPTDFHAGASLAPGLPVEQCLTEFSQPRSEAWVWLRWNFWEVYRNKKLLIPTCGR